MVYTCKLQSDLQSHSFLPCLKPFFFAPLAVIPHGFSWKLKYKVGKWIESRNSNDAVVVVPIVISVVAELM
jgi:hypothetical protein